MFYYKMGTRWCTPITDVTKLKDGRCCYKNDRGHVLIGDMESVLKDPELTGRTIGTRLFEFVKGAEEDGEKTGSRIAG